jgi:hypothetical protein
MSTSPTAAELRVKLRVARARAQTRGTATSRTQARRGDALGALLQAGVEDAGVLRCAQAMGAATAAVCRQGNGTPAAGLTDLLGLLAAARHESVECTSPPLACAVDGAGVPEAIGLERSDPDIDDEAPPEVDAAQYNRA